MVDMHALAEAMSRSNDDIAHLGASVFAAPLPFTPAAEPEAKPRKHVVWLALGLFVLSFAMLLGAFQVAHAKAVTPPTKLATTVTIAPPPAIETATLPTIATFTEARDVPPITTPRAASNVRPTVVTTAPTATATVETARCCPGESDTACAIRRSVGDACGSAPSAPFDRNAAAQALRSVDISTCKSAAGPTGAGHVQVTFQPNGTVSAADVDTPRFAGSAVGRCVAVRFKSAKVASFSGSALTVGKTLSLD